MNIRTKIDAMIKKELREANFPSRTELGYEGSKKVYLQYAEKLKKIKREILSTIAGTIIDRNFDNLIESLEDFHKD